MEIYGNSMEISWKCMEILWKKTCKNMKIVWKFMEIYGNFQKFPCFFHTFLGNFNDFSMISPELSWNFQ